MSIEEFKEKRILPPKEQISKLEELANIDQSIIKNMTGFLYTEVLSLFEDLKPMLKTSGRGKKPTLMKIDSLLYTLAFLAHGETYESMSRDYNINMTVLASNITDMIQHLSKMSRLWIFQIKREDQVLSNLQFTGLSEVAFVHGTFFCLCDKKRDVVKMPLYGVYGVQIQTLHHPNGTVAFFSEIYKATTPKLEMFGDMITFLDTILKKVERPEEGPEASHRHWAVLCDIKGADKLIRCVVKPDIARVEDERFKNIKEACKIPHMFYGRMLKLFGILSSELRRYSASILETLIACMALTNQHILLHKLEDSDGDYYNAWIQSLIEKGNENKLKRKAQSEKYRKKKN